MREQTVKIDISVFRSKLLVTIAVLCTLASFLAIPTAVMLFGDAFTAHILEDLRIGGISERGAQGTWLNLYRIVTALCVLCPALLAVGLWMLLSGRRAKAMTFLSEMFRVYGWVCNAVGLVLAVVFAVRFCLCVWQYLQYDAGVYLVFAMAVTEGIMAVVAWVAFRFLRRSFSALCDHATAMGYTLTSGRVDANPLPSLASSGSYVMAVVCTVLALDRLLTLTVSYEHVNAEYIVLFTSHVGQIFAGASLLMSAGASVLFAIYLRRVKRICERAIYEDKRKMEDRQWKEEF